MKGPRFIIICKSFGFLIFVDLIFWIVRPFYISPLIHFADMTHLQPDTRYFYQVGDDKGGWSAIYSFVTEPSKPPTPDRPLAIAVLVNPIRFSTCPLHIFF